MNGTDHNNSNDTLGSIADFLVHLAQARPQTEENDHEIFHYYRPNLASRGLNRPCELNELMSQAFGREAC